MKKNTTRRRPIIPLILQTFKTNMKNLDWLMIAMMTFLLIIGGAIILSITTVMKYNNIYDNPYHFIIRQGLGVGLGIIGILGISCIPYQWMKAGSFIAFVVNLILLGVTLVIGTGPGGVRSWLEFGPLRLQPAELVKIGLVLGIAWFAATHRAYYKHLSFKMMFLTLREPIPFMKKVRRYLISPWGMLAYTAVLLFLAMEQPDLGTGIIFMGTGIVMVLCSGISPRTLGQILLVLTLMFTGFWSVKDSILKDHQQERFMVWQQPFEFEQDIGYQNIGGYTAIAIGGLKGSGLGNSVQKYGYVVEPHNDFIISIVAEELGTYTVILIMIIYFTMTFRIISYAFRTQDLYASLVCVGIGVSFILQVMINLGGVSGTIPLTGVTLPFISYGGTSILTCFLLLAVYFNVRSAILVEEKEQVQAVLAEKGVDFQ